VEALESESNESDYVTRIDLQNGCVVGVDQSVLDALEEGDQESLQHLPEWQKPEIEIARAILDDNGERFVDPPGKFDFHEYRQMERSIQTVENAQAAEQLWRAIKGKGAFSLFQRYRGEAGFD
jgi:hypothetical protein